MLEKGGLLVGWGLLVIYVKMKLLLSVSVSGQYVYEYGSPGASIDSHQYLS